MGGVRWGGMKGYREGVRRGEYYFSGLFWGVEGDKKGGGGNLVFSLF